MRFRKTKLAIATAVAAMGVAVSAQPAQAGPSVYVIPNGGKCNPGYFCVMTVWQEGVGFYYDAWDYRQYGIDNHNEWAVNMGWPGGYDDVVMWEYAGGYGAGYCVPNLQTRNFFWSDSYSNWFAHKASAHQWVTHC